MVPFRKITHPPTWPKKREYDKLRRQQPLYVPESPLVDSLFLPVSEPAAAPVVAAPAVAPPAGEVLVYDSAPSSIESIETLSQDGAEKIDGPTQEVERSTTFSGRGKRRDRNVLGNNPYVRRSKRPKKGK